MMPNIEMHAHKWQGTLVLEHQKGLINFSPAIHVRLT